MGPIGVRAHDYGKQPPDSLFAAIAADGWETVQLAVKKAVSGVESTAGLTGTRLAEIWLELEKNNLTVGVLGAYVEPALADEQLRQESVAEFISLLSPAKTLGAGCIATETTKRARQPNVSQREAARALERSLGEILAAAEPLGMIVAVEPVWYHTLATPEAASALLRTMGSRYLKILFDPVNLLSPEDFDNQHALWDRCLDAFGGEIAAVHCKGIARRDGILQSVSLAESAVDYPDLFRRLKQLPQAFPILREEARQECAQADRAFLTALANG